MADLAERLRGGRPGRVREALVGYGFVALPMAVFCVFFLIPVGYAVYMSRYDWGIYGAQGSVGWGNYSELFHDSIFWRSIRNVLEYTIWVVPAQMALGLAMALVVNQPLRARSFFRGAYYFPSLASSAAITAIFIYLLDVDGLVNHILGAVGLPDNTSWFQNTRTALPSVAGLNAWTTSGTVMLFYLASLQAIPTDVYEAAAIDGAGRWRTFWKVTFPLLKPGHYFVAVVSVIGAMKVFDQNFIVSRGSGGPDYATLSPVLNLYLVAVHDIRWGYAAAMGVTLFVVIFAITLIQRQFFGRTEAA
jgi:ABC-type sugar transport system permease subunit